MKYKEHSFSFKYKIFQIWHLFIKKTDGYETLFQNTCFNLAQQL